MNGQLPVFLKLNPEQQLRVGNELMALIKARTGSMKGAVEFIEGGGRLKEFGLLDETISLLGCNSKDNNLLKLNATSFQMAANQPAVLIDTIGGTQ